MKKITLILILLTCNIISGQTIFQGKIIYSVSLKNTKLDMSKIDKKKNTKKTINTVKRIYKESVDVDAILLFNQTESLYMLLEKMQNEANKKINLTKIFAGDSNRYYVNNTTKEYLYQTNTSGEYFLIPFKPIKWKLTRNEKKIGNYLCYKAINKKTFNGIEKEVIAWYTPQIPVNFGPLKYHGLPGLILELDEGSIIFKAKTIELNKNNKKIKKPTKGMKITSKEYSNISENFFKRLNKKERN